MFIWGLLEARLQSVDVVVLGGLGEGVWPPGDRPRPVDEPADARARRPALAGGAGRPGGARFRVRRLRRRGASCCPARAAGTARPPCRRAGWRGSSVAGRAGTSAAARTRLRLGAASSTSRTGRPCRRRRPGRCPPCTLRPRKLSVTEIETWLRDPYAIYARHILRLRALDPLDEAADAADYGEIVHPGCTASCARHGAAWPADAAARAARGDATRAARARGCAPALAAWWAPRLRPDRRLGAATRRSAAAPRPPRRWRTEASGESACRAAGRRCSRCRGRADRIERRPTDARHPRLQDRRAADAERRSMTAWRRNCRWRRRWRQAGAFGPDFAGAERRAGLLAADRRLRARRGARRCSRTRRGSPKP